MIVGESGQDRGGLQACPPPPCPRPIDCTAGVADVLGPIRPPVAWPGTARPQLGFLPSLPLCPLPHGWTPSLAVLEVCLGITVAARALTVASFSSSLFVPSSGQDPGGLMGEIVQGAQKGAEPHSGAPVRCTARPPVAQGGSASRVQPSQEDPHPAGLCTKLVLVLLSCRNGRFLMALLSPRTSPSVTRFGAPVRPSPPLLSRIRSSPSPSQPA